MTGELTLHYITYHSVRMNDTSKFRLPLYVHIPGADRDARYLEHNDQSYQQHYKLVQHHPSHHILPKHYPVRDIITIRMNIWKKMQQNEPTT